MDNLFHHQLFIVCNWFQQWTEQQRLLMLKGVLSKVVPQPLDELSDALEQMSLPSKYQEDFLLANNGQINISFDSQLLFVWKWMGGWSNEQKNRLLNELAEIDIHLLNVFQDWVRQLKWK